MILCFFLPSLLAVIISRKLQIKVMTNIPWGYIPIVPIKPFYHLIRLEMCVIYMTGLSWVLSGEDECLCILIFSH